MAQKNNTIVAQPATQSLIQDLRQIIEQARGHVAATANYELTMMYWHIGERINREVLGNERADYGKQIVSAVSTQLQAEYGKKGLEPRSIWRMMQFAQEFPDVEIVSAVSTKITWSHIIEILPLKDDLQREFYLTLAASERWSIRQLRKEIDGMLFERTAISGKPDEFIKKELSTLRDDHVMSPDLVFKSPWLNKENGRSIIKHKYTGGPTGCEVWLYEVVNGPHSWFDHDIDTGEEIWSFFSKYLK